MYQLEIITVEINLSGCRSLKEKRQRLGGIRDRIGKQSNIAIIESGQQDQLQRSTWTVTVIAGDNANLARTVSWVEQQFLERIDGEIMRFDREHF